MVRMVSNAQARLLREVPDKWKPMPPFTDSRPVHAAIKKGLIEVHNEVVEQYGPLKFVTVKWRLTPKGKQALARLRELDGEDFL